MEGRKQNDANNYINCDDVRNIVKNFTSIDKFTVNTFKIRRASDKMMGYLADYWKLEVEITVNGSATLFNFFIKSVCRNNPSKAAMVNEWKLFEKEATFYNKIKPRLEIPGIQPWSPRLASSLDQDLVMEDLTSLGYQCRSKFENFDIAVCKIGLEAIARFHAGSIVYEENMRKSGRPWYTLSNDFKLHKGGYIKESSWFLQCLRGSLEVMKEFSKYRENFHKIEEKWSDIWFSALELSGAQKGCRSVICHCDLWNNNLLYHYDSLGIPDSCCIVDYQAVTYQPPAGDIALFLYCSNIDSLTLDKLFPQLVNYYHDYMGKILETAGVLIDSVLPLEELMRTLQEQRKWGLILSCCLFPQMFIDDVKVTEIFTDAKRFENIMTKEKGKFIKTMMDESRLYREKVLERFEEIVWRYIPEVTTL